MTAVEGKRVGVGLESDIQSTLCERVSGGSESEAELQQVKRWLLPAEPMRSRHMNTPKPAGLCRVKKHLREPMRVRGVCLDPKQIQDLK